MNVYSQVPNIIIPSVNNTDEEDNVPLNEICSIIVQERVPSIGRTLIGLGRPSPLTSNRSLYIVDDSGACIFKNLNE